MDPTWWPSLLAYTSSSKVFQKLQKRFDNLITSSHIFFYKARISLSNDLEILNPLESNNNVASMLIISAIVVIKASHNSQWPFDWFMTHANTTKFKQNVIVLATIDTWAFDILCCKATTFYLGWKHDEVYISWSLSRKV
jgi:hypothetical protein